MGGMYWGGSVWGGALVSLAGIFCLLVFLGVLAALIWMFRFAKQEVLKKIAVFALVIGLLGGAFSSLAMAQFAPWGGKGAKFKPGSMMRGDYRAEKRFALPDQAQDAEVEVEVEEEEVKQP